MLHLPPVYPITDPAHSLDLHCQIRRLGEAGFPLVQFRGKGLDIAKQWRELRIALTESAANGGWPMICVNDRADLALLAAEEGLDPWGLHLGQSDLPPFDARRLPGLEGLHLGTSTHDEGEWTCVDTACDHAGVGPFRATASKGDHARPIGLSGLEKGCRLLRERAIAPIAIGGITMADMGHCFQAGAESLAMIGEIARAADPSDLLWEAQRLRWAFAPPIRRGQGVVLIGGSGSGKSVLARELAFRLGLPPTDLDDEIVGRSGKSIAQIFQEDGEKAFRAMEAALLSSLLENPCVLALGGGAWEDASSRSLVAQSGFAVLWLAETPARAWERVKHDEARPLAAKRDEFMARWRTRMAAWSLEQCVLPLRRTAAEYADALT